MTAPDLQKRDANPESFTLTTTIEPRTDSPNSTILEPVPHPVYCNVFTLPMLHPNLTIELVTIESARVEGDILWWYLAGF
jgi:hypothetical protein